MSKKVYVALRALPWERLNVAIGKDTEGKIHTVQAASDEQHAGFLPVYWSEEAARKENPHAEIQIGEVSDTWGDPEEGKPLGAQGLVLFGQSVDDLDRKGLVDLARTAEDKLSLRMVLMARERILGGKEPTTRFGEDRLRKYLTELHTASTAP